MASTARNLINFSQLCHDVHIQFLVLRPLKQVEREVLPADDRRVDGFHVFKIHEHIVHWQVREVGAAGPPRPALYHFQEIM